MRVELIDGAETQAERLTRLVEDLLTVSRIQDGVLRLSMEPVDPRDLIADAARASSTTERLRLELDAPARVVCDADAIVRVLTNLFDNAREVFLRGHADRGARSWSTTVAWRSRFATRAAVSRRRIARRSSNGSAGPTRRGAGDGARPVHLARAGSGARRRARGG